MRLLIAILLLASSPTWALTTEEVFSIECATGAVNRATACGSDLTAVSYDTAAGTLSVTSNVPVGSDAPLYARWVPNGVAVPNRFEIWQDASLLDAASDTLTATPGETGAVCAAQRDNFVMSAVVCSGQVTIPTGAASTAMRFLPGMYFSGTINNPNDFENPQNAINKIGNSRLCANGSPWRGWFVRAQGWANVAKGPGDYDFSLWDAIHDYFDSGQCDNGNGLRPRLIVGIYASNFGSHAVSRSCVPADLSSRAEFWEKNNGNGRCIAKFDSDTLVINRWYETMEAIADWCESHELCLGLNVKGESAWGFGGIDNPTYTNQNPNFEQLKDDMYEVYREGMRRYRARSPSTMVTMGGNYFASQNQTEIDRRVGDFTSVFDAIGGMGWQHPDSFNTNNGFPGQPATSTYRFYPGWFNTATRQPKYVVVAEMQLEKSRCPNGTADCIAPSQGTGFQFSGSSNVDLNGYSPVLNSGDYQGFGTSYLLKLEGKNSPYTDAQAEAAYAAGGGEVVGTGCPTSWEAAGFTCAVPTN